ncbi:MAG: hypothetical protein ABIK95_12225 [Acidobacteriota bacterium]
MDVANILKIIKDTRSPLKKQLLLVSLVSSILREKEKSAPIVIGGCALSYYSREVYFTADIDLAYADRDALDVALKELDFEKSGRYWINDELSAVIEIPTHSLVGETAPVEIVEFEHGLSCQIIGIEDLLIDRLNACKHWKSQTDCEMVELLVKRNRERMNWEYLINKASLPENDTKLELERLRETKKSADE